MPKPATIGTIVGAFKSAVTKHLNLMNGTIATKVWQRNFYEHIIRNEAELDHVRQNIADNPARWAKDRENPLNGEVMIGNMP